MEGEEDKRYYYMTNLLLGQKELKFSKISLHRFLWHIRIIEDYFRILYHVIGVGGLPKKVAILQSESILRCTISLFF